MVIAALGIFSMMMVVVAIGEVHQNLLLLRHIIELQAQDILLSMNIIMVKSLDFL